MEEFRAAARRPVRPDASSTAARCTSERLRTLPGGAVRLSEDGRKTVLTEWQQCGQSEWPHTLLGRNGPRTACCPSVQARLLARHLRGELPSYIPWLAR